MESKDIRVVSDRPAMGDFILFPIILLIFMYGCSDSCKSTTNIFQCSGKLYEGISNQFIIGRMQAVIPEGEEK